MLVKSPVFFFCSLNITYMYFANITLIFLFSTTFAFSQLELVNASFEDEPADATLPSGWWKIDKETTPDILPGFWGVYHEASEGNTYLGLITRPNRTWECIGQKLSTALAQGTCYTMGLDLAHSDTYAGYSNPTKIKIYLSSKKKKKEQLIYESPLIEHEEWETYTFKFTPKKKMQYLLIEVYHEEVKSVGHEGNILIDAISPIYLCNKA